MVHPAPTLPDAVPEVGDVCLTTSSAEKQRSLQTDPRAALLAMHTGVSDLLHIHYCIHGRWWVRSKWVLNDLSEWDVLGYTRVAHLVVASDHTITYHLWSERIDHMLTPVGGRQSIRENNSSCPLCKEDLTRITSTDKRQETTTPYTHLA